MPYRSAPPLRVYPIRTSWLMVGVGLFVAGLFLVGLLMFAWMLATPTRGPSFFAVYLFAGSAIAAFAYAASIKNELVAGGRGEVRLFPTHVEVPSSWAGGPFRLPLDTLEQELVRFEGRVFFQTVSRAAVLVLRAEGQRRGLSSRLFARPADLDRLARDLAALKLGAPLPSHEAGPGATALPRAGEPDEYDTRLDAELDDLD